MRLQKNQAQKVSDFREILDSDLFVPKLTDDQKTSIIDCLLGAALACKMTDLRKTSINLQQDHNNE